MEGRTREPVVYGASESDQHSLAATHDRHKIVWSFGRLQESREFWAISGIQRRMVLLVGAGNSGDELSR